MGDPEKSTSEIGPVVDQAQYEKILSIVDIAKKEKQGCLLQGGEKLNSRVGCQSC